MGALEWLALGPVSLAFLLFNASSVAGLLLQGLFVFSLSDAIPLASPVLAVVDLSLQLLLSLLQLVASSMFWRLRNAQNDPQLLAGLQRAGCVLVALQLLVFATFGAASPVVLFRPGYAFALALFVVCTLAMLWSIWQTDMLSDRGTMLVTALKFDFVALLVLCCYGLLHLHQQLDALASGSSEFARLVAGNQWILGVSCFCGAVLLYVVGLWASCKEVTLVKSGGSKNPVQAASLGRIQFWNVVCAAGALLGAPIVVPCLVAHVLVGSTLHVDPVGGRDMFFKTRGDRFDMEY